MTLDPSTVGVLLVAATALHLGFQLTVSLVVYPALARTPADRWQAAHDAHSRAIVPVVVLAYAAVLLGCGLAVGALPWSWGLALAIAGSAVALVTTAVAAAPTHGSLAAFPDPVLLVRLRRVDAVRTAGAVLALVGALAART